MGKIANKLYAVFLVLLLLRCANTGALNLNQLNNQLGDIDRGVFQRDANGYIIYSRGPSPQFAIDAVLDSLGIKKGFGTAGVDPFKKYMRIEHRRSALSHYEYLCGHTHDVWKEEDDKNGADSSRYGINIIKEAGIKFGSDVFEKIHDSQQAEQRRNAMLLTFFTNVVPNLVKKFSEPKVILLSFGGVFALIGVPIIIWNLTKSVFGWLFQRRPTILGHEDSDINYFWKRLFFRQKKLPKVIVNKNLETKLSQIIERNKKITKDNKDSRGKVKRFYPHLLLYGNYGVGKTLWSKQLAKQSGMHFMYMTVGDIAQQPEELALEDMKRFFAMARRYGPTVLIIDEVDRLFPQNGEGAVSDDKLSKIKVLFQKEFSKAVDSRVQMVLITNFPSSIPGGIKARCAKKIFFPNPDYNTKIKLFKLHLALAGVEKNKVEGIVEDLTSVSLDGLVGRDIEAISHDYYALGAQGSLNTIINDYKASSVEMDDFDISVFSKKKKKVAQQQQETTKQINENSKPNRFYR